MRITTVGRGTVGGGLAARWRNAGHEVTEPGPDGGDASEADAVLLAVASGAIDDALSKVTGLEGKVVIDATNDFGPFGGRDASFPSLAHQVKARTNGPVAKSFNLNFSRIYDRRAGPAGWQPLRRGQRGPRPHGAADPRRGLRLEPDECGRLLRLRCPSKAKEHTRCPRPGTRSRRVVAPAQTLSQIRSL